MAITACGKNDTVNPSKVEAADLLGFWVAEGDGEVPTVLEFGTVDHSFPELVDTENPWFLYQDPSSPEVPVSPRFLRQAGTYVAEDGKLGTLAVLERDGREIYATNSQYENEIIEFIRGDRMTLSSQVTDSGQRTFEFYEDCPTHLFEQPHTNIGVFQMPEAETRLDAGTGFGIAFDPRDEELHMIYSGSREGFYGSRNGHCEAFPRQFPPVQAASMTADETGTLWAIVYDLPTDRLFMMSQPPDQLDKEWTFAEIGTSTNQPGVDIGMGPNGPFAATSSDGIVKFYEQINGGWVPQQVTNEAETFSPWVSAAVGPDGTAYAVYSKGSGTNVFLAARVDGTWTEADLGVLAGVGATVTVAPDGTIAALWDTTAVMGDLPMNALGRRGTDSNGFHAADTLMIARGKSIDARRDGGGGVRPRHVPSRRV